MKIKFPKYISINLSDPLIIATDKSFSRNKIESVLRKWNFQCLVCDEDFEKVLDECVGDL